MDTGGNTTGEGRARWKRGIRCEGGTPQGKGAVGKGRCTQQPHCGLKGGEAGRVDRIRFLGSTGGNFRVDSMRDCAVPMTHRACVGA